MWTTLFLISTVWLQAPASRPSTQPAETYPALRRLLEKTQAELDTVRTELYQLRDENRNLRAQLAEIRGREDQQRDAVAKYKLAPEQAEAFEQGVVLVGMPFAAVQDMCKPSKFRQTSASTSADWYQVVFTRLSYYTDASSGGVRRIKGEPLEPYEIGVDPRTGLVFAVQGSPSLPGAIRRHNATIK